METKIEIDRAESERYFLSEGQEDGVEKDYNIGSWRAKLMKSKRIIIGVTDRNNSSNTLECCFYKLIKEYGRNWNRNMSGYIWQSYFFEKR